MKLSCWLYSLKRSLLIWAVILLGLFIGQKIWAATPVAIMIPSLNDQPDAIAQAELMAQEGGRLKVRVLKVSKGGAFGLSCIGTPAEGQATWERITPEDLKGRLMWVDQKYYLPLSQAKAWLVERENLRQAFYRWLDEAPMFADEQAEANIKAAQSLNWPDMHQAWQLIKLDLTWRKQGYMPKLDQQKAQEAAVFLQKLKQALPQDQAWLNLWHKYLAAKRPEVRDFKAAQDSEYFYRLWTLATIVAHVEDLETPLPPAAQKIYKELVP